MTAPKFKKTILCIGAGYVGGPTMAMIAAKCPDYQVHVVDINAERIAQWQTGRSADLRAGPDGGRGRGARAEPVLLHRHRRRASARPTSSSSASTRRRRPSARARARRPTCSTGRRRRARSWSTRTSDKIVVEKSTLPVRTAEAMERILHTGQDGVHFEVLSNPEFLAEGTAMRGPRSSPTAC